MTEAEIEAMEAEQERKAEQWQKQRDNVVWIRLSAQWGGLDTISKEKK